MLKGGIIVRGFDESRKDRGIREVEIFGLLAEVEIRRRAQSEATVTEIDGVEIFFEYLVLGISLFQRSGEFKFFSWHAMPAADKCRSSCLQIVCI